jgi:type IX secretion system PorP/SprF family membrane protein
MMSRSINFLFLFLASYTYAQQLPQFTQFSNNVSIVNNANFINETNSVNIGARSQMLGFGLEPNSAFVYGSYGLKKKPQPNYNPQIRISKPIPKEVIKPSRIQHAIAAIALIDRYGAFSRTHLSGIYNLGYNINSNWNLSGSFKLGFSSLGFNSDKAVVLNSNNPFAEYVNGDAEYDAFVSGNTRATTIDLGSAIFVSSKSFKAGFSCEQLAGNALSFVNGGVNFNQKLHYTILLGYNYQWNKVNLELMGLVKQMNPAPISIDLSARATFENGFWAGMNYRHNSALGFLVGMNFSKSIRLGYSYDLITNRLNNFSFGGHELILGYAF